jgi:hypothetical protein
MTKVTIEPGVCGFTTTVTATTEDGQHVRLGVESTCPNLAGLREETIEVDAFREVTGKPHETQTYQLLAQRLPHCSCPLYSGFFKAVEVAAGLALPRDVRMTFES